MYLPLSYLPVSYTLSQVSCLYISSILSARLSFPPPQVIGEAVLSLSPEECDRVFPTLYLPVMTEGNKRVLRPYRKYVPIPAWWKFKSNMKALNSYLIGLIRGRWHARKAGNAPKKGDILDRCGR